MACKRLRRREFLAAFSAMAAGGTLFTRSALALDGQRAGLIRDIRRSVVFDGRNKTDEAAWFQTRACIVPTPDGLNALMTMQRVSGSDYYHPVCSTTSTDLGRTWSEPRPIPGMGRQPADDDTQVGVCDVVPEFHPPTGTVLAMGHNVYYGRGRFFRDQPPRWPVYAVRDASGRWTPTARLVWDDPRGSAIYTCGCSQRVTLPDGDLLIALSFAPKGRTDRMVASVRCGFDGLAVTVEKTSNVLELPKKRGLLEPSLTSFDGRMWMTIRAEDNRGYLATSDDGLKWSSPKPWTWDDGSPLVTSTTQQHWLTHSDGLFLVYTRRAENNRNVFRWRAPMFLAQVDARRQCLIRDTEQVVFPLVGDGVKNGKHVARMGNFGVNHATPRESWITGGECLPKDGYRGDVLLARVAWNRPNRLAAGGIV
ncbi:MAG: exo-alpha-sialidase [Pirellulales bacterium]|nr:exo-alpha-sialidase [Pirellulales bacterium]